MLKNHSGAVTVEDIITSPTGEFIAHVIMNGGCKGCAGAKYTLNMFVSNKIKEFEPKIVEVIDITDHTDKSQAYYKE